MTAELNSLLKRANLHPVLFDVGASGQPPPIWSEIAPQAIYVGFDPDRRDCAETVQKGYFRSSIINEAITCEKGKGEVTLHLTRSPYCSSMLAPDPVALMDVFSARLFDVERKTIVPARTIDEVIGKLELHRIHWLKTDSQGLDLRIYLSISKAVRSAILAVDMEPGLVDAYLGEDLFVDVHRTLQDEGFWLSRLAINGLPRMRYSTWETVKPMLPGVTEESVAGAVRKSPGWCEIRYFRTLSFLEKSGATKEDYITAWVFAVMDYQLGHALDLVTQYIRIYGRDNESSMMLESSTRRLRYACQAEDESGTWRAGVKTFLRSCHEAMLKKRPE